MYSLALNLEGHERRKELFNHGGRKIYQRLNRGKSHGPRERHASVMHHKPRVLLDAEFAYMSSSKMSCTSRLQYSSDISCLRKTAVN